MQKHFVFHHADDNKETYIHPTLIDCIIQKGKKTKIYYTLNDENKIIYVNEKIGMVSDLLQSIVDCVEVHLYDGNELSYIPANKILTIECGDSKLNDITIIRLGSRSSLSIRTHETLKQIVSQMK